MTEIIDIKEFDRRKAKAPRFKRTNTNTIMATEFEPIRWTIPGYVAEGFTVLAGRQKLGKTWLAIDWALAVATGMGAMGGIECEQGDVLYIDMENGPRRIQRRIDAIYPDATARPDLGRLEWVTESMPLDKGFIEALDDWRLSVRSPRLVIVDVLQRIKPVGNAARNSYENDYSAWAPLQKWATDHGIAVVGLHHTKKGGADDPLEALSGSNGLSACADTTIVLDRDANGTTLYVRGRDAEECETMMDFTAGIWTVKGDAGDIRRTTERSEILSVLIDASEPMTPRDIAVAVERPRNNVDQLLYKLGKAGEVQKVCRGLYVHSERRDLIPPETVTPGKNDKKIRNGDDDNEISGLDI